MMDPSLPDAVVWFPGFGVAQANWSTCEFHQRVRKITGGNVPFIYPSMPIYNFRHYGDLPNETLFGDDVDPQDVDELATPADAATRMHFSPDVLFSPEDLDIDHVCCETRDRVSACKRVWVIGHSIGGLFALRFSQLFRDQCAMVVLLDSAIVCEELGWVARPPPDLDDDELYNLQLRVMNTCSDDQMRAVRDLGTFVLCSLFAQSPALVCDVPLLIAQNHDDGDSPKWARVQEWFVERLQNISPARVHVVHSHNGGHFFHETRDGAEAVVGALRELAWALPKDTTEERIDAVVGRPFRISLSASSDVVYRFAGVYHADERAGCGKRSNGISFSGSLAVNPFVTTPWPTAEQVFEFVGRVCGRYYVVFDKMCHGRTVPVQYAVVVRDAWVPVRV